jgi:hypothetical protein
VEKGAPKKVMQASGYTAQAFSDWWRNEFKVALLPISLSLSPNTQSLFIVSLSCLVLEFNI